MTGITAQYVRELFHYDETTGIFTRKHSRNNAHPIGGIAGTVQQRGYIDITVDYRHYKAHRLAWLYVYGEWPNGEIDHINFIKTDNRIVNLRVCTRRQNMQHRISPKCTNKLGILGVSPSGNKFMARIVDEGKEVYLGTFDSAIEAHSAYVKAKERFHVRN